MIKLKFENKENGDVEVGTEYAGNGLDIITEFCILTDKFLEDFAEGNKELKKDVFVMITEVMGKKLEEENE